MMKRKQTRVRLLLGEIEEMKASGKTHREIAEHFGFKDKYVVKELLKRERRKKAKEGSGVIVDPTGKPRREATSEDIETKQANEIKRLKMENELLRDFLRLTGRK